MNLPNDFLKNMQDLLEEDFPKYLESFNEPRLYGLRVNTTKISVADFLKISPFKLEPVPWCKEGFYYDGENEKPAKHPYYYAGLYYLQEPSAMIPGSVLPIAKDDIVLDGCSAPGGKSTQICNKLQGSGCLFSNDIATSRCQGLLKNIELSGNENVVVSSLDMISMSKEFKNFFDKILLDVPCSGEGMFRKESTLISSWKEKGNEYYALVQKQILHSGFECLKPGGKLVYSTCTFSIKEDEEVLLSLLEKYPNAKLLPIEKYDGFEDGKLGLTQAKRLYPFKIKGEGHFVALVEKEKSDCDCNSLKPFSYCYPEAFLNHLKIDLSKYYIQRYQDKLVLNACDNNLLAGKRILRNGLLLGTYKNDIFEPSTQLALFLKKNQFDQVIDLSSQDERVLRYLKGESIDVKEYVFEGYVLICVDSYPLGFGKITKGIFKNKYDKNWRYL